MRTGVTKLSPLPKVSLRSKSEHKLKKESLRVKLSVCSKMSNLPYKVSSIYVPRAHKSMRPTDSTIWSQAQQPKSGPEPEFTFLVNLSTHLSNCHSQRSPCHSWRIDCLLIGSLLIDSSQNDVVPYKLQYMRNEPGLIKILGSIKTSPRARRRLDCFQCFVLIKSKFQR